MVLTYTNPPPGSQMCVQLLLPASAFTLLVLGPLYWHGGGMDKHGNAYTGPDRRGPAPAGAAQPHRQVPCSTLKPLAACR